MFQVEENAQINQNGPSSNSSEHSAKPARPSNMQVSLTV